MVWLSKILGMTYNLERMEYTNTSSLQCTGSLRRNRWWRNVDKQIYRTPSCAPSSATGCVALWLQGSDHQNWHGKGATIVTWTMIGFDPVEFYINSRPRIHKSFRLQNQQQARNSQQRQLSIAQPAAVHTKPREPILLLCPWPGPWWVSWPRCQMMLCQQGRGTSSPPGQRSTRTLYHSCAPSLRLRQQFCSCSQLCSSSVTMQGTERKRRHF